MAIMRSSRNCKESIGRDHLPEEPFYGQLGFQATSSCYDGILRKFGESKGRGKERSVPVGIGYRVRSSVG